MEIGDSPFWFAGFGVNASLGEPKRETGLGRCRRLNHGNPRLKQPLGFPFKRRRGSSCLNQPCQRPWAPSQAADTMFEAARFRNSCVAPYQRHA